ncbi:MAG: VWA domain-containing protein [Anaerolineae bacterium]|nr:VWA domain-containing protein [Anaerolineae bacterium]
MSGETYYSILGLSKTASLDEIQDAFAVLAGRFPENASIDSNPEYGKLLQAYEVLSDKDRRAIYDSLLVETTPPSLEATVQISRTKMAISDSAQLFYLLIEITPPTHVVRARRPLNLCLALDRSTSMQGTRLDYLKTAVSLIIDKLAPDDIISIVSYSDRAEIVVEPTHINNKNQIIAHVRNIQASGGTEIYQGLYAGVTQMRQISLDQYNNQLILLTDGHTYGDTEQCIELAQRASETKIGFSAFGIGAQWNDSFLDQLVAPSGGRSAYIEDPTQIVKYLEDRIQGLGTIHARNLHLKKAFPGNTTPQYGFKLLPFSQPIDLSGSELNLGNLEGKGSLAILLELLLQPQEHETRITIPIEITAEIPEQNNHIQKITKQIQILVTARAPETAPPEDIVKAVRMLNMYRMNEKVWQDIEAGHIGVAATRLRHLTTRLLEAGEIQLAQQANAETERLNNAGELSEEGRKRLKFGTRAMIGQTLKLEE